jgi:delta(3,5)-delta(2,4)-dienoyl-CoA isomerase
VFSTSNLDRLSQRNVLSRDFPAEFAIALQSLDQNPNAFVIILLLRNRHQNSKLYHQRFWRLTRPKVHADAITAIERCRKPVIAAIEGACIGGGTDIVIACDIWFRSKDAFFSVKEAGLGLTADSWTLQRLSGIIELGNAMELALTGLRFSGQEARDLGLVYRVLGSRGIARGCENHSIYWF